MELSTPVQTRTPGVGLPEAASSDAACGLSVEADPRFAHLFESVACDLCSGTDLRVVYDSTLSAEDLEHSLEQHTYSGWTNAAGRIVQCRGCRLRFVSPRERASGIWQTYRQIVDPLYLQNLDARRVSFARGLRQLQRLRRPPGRLLDVGCSVGVFLELGRDAGWDAEGVEASEWSAAQARSRGLAVHNELFEQAPLPSAAYDVICFWDVLEHVPSPRAVLRKAHDLLRPGGLLLVSTPNVRSLSALALGRRWWFIERDHIYYYTPGTLAEHLRRCGFMPRARHPVLRTYPTRYLMHKLGAYLPRVSGLAGRWVERLHLGDVPVAIPAGQITVLAEKT
jgi:2-polyprenyl-3-methyl-5-hydroxy-6-metoxy-1,4-benzoquinol methylase